MQRHGLTSPRSGQWQRRQFLVVAAVVAAPSPCLRCLDSNVEKVAKIAAACVAVVAATAISDKRQWQRTLRARLRLGGPPVHPSSLHGSMLLFVVGRCRSSLCIVCCRVWWCRVCCLLLLLCALLLVGVGWCCCVLCVVVCCCVLMCLWCVDVC